MEEGGDERMSINHAIIIGRLGADPELKKTQSGLSVCSFSLAVDRPKAKGQEKPVTDWINCADNVMANPVAALQSMGAKGYYEAVHQIAFRKKGHQNKR